jgi:orotidine-5'-phosphate decarboxylase
VRELNKGRSSAAKKRPSRYIPKDIRSSKDIPVNERLIIALDVPSSAEAKKVVEQLGDTVAFYKLGLQLFMADGYFDLVRWLDIHGKKIFVDLKFFDVPETVKKAVSQLQRWPAAFITVHGNDGMLEAAVSQRKNGMKILAVTALTSLDRADLQDLGFKCDVKDLVLSRAKRALNLGCDGVVSSGLEAPVLRNSLGENFLVVTPGIRPVDNNEGPKTDDQKRTTDVEEAFTNGADYIVVGRPVMEAADRRAAAAGIQERIANLFSRD